MDKLGSDEMMDSDEMMGGVGHGMMNDHEMMMNHKGMMMDDRRMGKARAEDGDTIEPLRRVVQPEVRVTLKRLLKLLFKKINFD